MSNTKTKFSFLMMLIFSICLLSFLLIGSLMTVSAADGEPTVVTTEAELTDALTAGGHIQLDANITATANHTIASGKAVVLDLSEYTLDMGSYYITNNGTLELRGEAGGEITGIGYCVLENYGSFTLTSGIVSNTNSSYTTIDCHSGGEVIINGGTVNGAYIGILTTGSITMNGGTVFGGDIAVENAGTLTVNDGSIEGNTFGIKSWLGTIEITGGMIVGNGGAGVEIDDGALSVSGGTLDGAYYGINIGSDGAATLSGGTIGYFRIENNDLTIADCLAPGYLYYYYEDGSVVTVAEGSKQMLFTFTVAPCQNHTGGTENCDKMSVCTVCRGEYIRHPDENGDCICDVCSGFTFPGTGTELDPFIVASDAELTAALTAGGNIQLGADITATTKNYFIYTTVSIDLNGHTIDLGGKYFEIRTSATLEICDSGSSGMVVGTGDKVIYNILGGHFTLTSGTIRNDNGESYNDSCAIYNANSSEMVMNGGTVSGTSYGINIVDGSKATINSGTVSGIDSYGISNTVSTLIVNGGDVWGGLTGIENYGGTVTVSGGRISAYNADSTGVSAIFNYDAGTVTISGDTQISLSNDDSFGIYNADGTVNMLGATITVSGEYSYAIYNMDTFSLSGGTIQGNILTSAGGVADLLKPGYLYYNENGEVITLTEGQTELSGTVKVAECQGHSFSVNGLCSICRYACLHEEQDESMELCPVCQKPAALQVTAGTETFYFTGLAHALAKAEECYTMAPDVPIAVKLCDDITVSGPITLSGAELTLDLNGRTVTFPFATGDCWTLDGATLTIDDTSAEQTGMILFKMEDVDSCGITLTNASGLTLENGTMKAQPGYPLMLLGDSTVTQNGGTIYNGVFIDNGKYILEDGVLKGSFHSNSNGDSSKYVIKLELNGGTMIAIGSKLIDFSAYPKIELIVTGGSYSDRNGLPLYLPINGAVPTLSGGVFETGIKSDWEPLTELLAEGYAFYDESGELILLSEEQTEIDERVTVAPCTHNGTATHLSSLADGTHAVICALCGAATETKACVYDQSVASAAFLQSPATCILGTTYFKSCECGHKSTETFVDGSPDPTNHDWNTTDVCSRCHAVKISEKTFPDANFRAYLSDDTTLYELDDDGVLTQDELKLITRLTAMVGRGISDLTGIEYFTELTTLDCQSNWLKSIDLSKNTKLESVTLGRQTWVITIAPDATFDLNTLGIDVSKLTIPEGCAVNDGVIKFEAGSHSVDGFTYPSGYGEELFAVRLRIENPHTHASVETFDDCTKEEVCLCGDITKAAKAHTPEDDDGNCTTDILCSVCDVVTTKGNESHTGGAATCQAQANCSVCATAYGELALDRHTSTDVKYEANNNGTHAKKHACCNAVIASGEACCGGTATCTVKAVCEHCGAFWGALAPHTSGTATCTEKATCTVCGTATDEALGHDFRGIGMDENEHWRKCERCDAIGERAAHTIDGGLCTVCEYQPQKSGLSVGATAAIVGACVAVLGGGGLALWWFVFKKKR